MGTITDQDLGLRTGGPSLKDITHRLRILVLGLQSSALTLTGGASRDRTGDLYNAIVALSQLSYGPEKAGYFTVPCCEASSDRRRLAPDVIDCRIEPTQRTLAPDECQRHVDGR